MRLLQVLVPQVEKICIDKSVYFVFISIFYVFMYFFLTVRSDPKDIKSCSIREMSQLSLLPSAGWENCSGYGLKAWYG